MRGIKRLQTLCFDLNVLMVYVGSYSVNLNMNLAPLYNKGHHARCCTRQIIVAYSHPDKVWLGSSLPTLAEETDRSPNLPISLSWV